MYRRPANAFGRLYQLCQQRLPHLLLLHPGMFLLWRKNVLCKFGLAKLVKGLLSHTIATNKYKVFNKHIGEYSGWLGNEIARAGRFELRHTRIAPEVAKAPAKQLSRAYTQSEPWFESNQPHCAYW